MSISYVSSFSRTRKEGVELRMYREGAGGEMAYFARRFCSLPCVLFARLDLRARAASPGLDEVSEMKCSLDRNGRARATREVEKGRRDALLKFATLSVASLRLIKNCAGLHASLFAGGQGNCTRVTIK